MKYLILIISSLIVLPLVAQGHCGSCSAYASPAPQKVAPAKEVIALGAARQAQWISSDYYLVYEWNKKPKIGTHILKVKIFDRGKKQVNNLTLTADAFMPSMKGAHDTGDKAMKLNKKNEFAIPVYFMMLGDWEILLKIKQGNKEIAQAAVRLKI